jgi:hypothetical protein
VRGVNYFTIGDLTDEELASLEADLAAEGLALDDFAMGFAGRADPSDPPYHVNVIHIKGVPAIDIPLGISMEHPEAGEFEQLIIGGKQVWRGAAGMIEQSEHGRGTPYVYLSGEYHFIVLTEDEEWAADALAQLP